MARAQQLWPILEEMRIFGQGLKVQGRAVGALMLLNARVESRSHYLGVFWYFFEPVAHMLFWLAYRFFIRFVRSDLRGAMGGHGDGGLQMGLIVTGIVPFFTMMKISDGIGDAVTTNKSLLLFPTVKPIDIMLAQSLFNIVKMTLVSAFILTLSILVGFVDPPADVDRLVISYMTCIIFAISFAFALLILSNRVRLIGFIFSKVFYRVNYLAAGVVYPIQSMPPDIAYWVKFNPIAHCIDLFRQAYYPVYQGAFGSNNYVLLWSASLCFVGLIIERLLGYRLKEA